MEICNVYTDGSCNNDTKVGGYGIVFMMRGRMRKVASDRYKDTTNNRMELKAIIKALEILEPGPYKIDIHSDSEYCVKSITYWLDNWIKKGKLRDKANADLWTRYIAAAGRHRKGSIKLIWIRGHNGHEFNEMADKLANQARLNRNKSKVCKTNN